MHLLWWAHWFMETWTKYTLPVKIGYRGDKNRVARALARELACDLVVCAAYLGWIAWIWVEAQFRQIYRFGSCLEIQKNGLFAHQGEMEASNSKKYQNKLFSANLDKACVAGRHVCTLKFAPILGVLVGEVSRQWAIDAILGHQVIGTPSDRGWIPEFTLPLCST